MNKPFVAILMGSQADLTIMEGAADVFDKLQISYEIKITSAHRTPANTQNDIADAEARGYQVFISGAGLAAHLGGATEKSEFAADQTASCRKRYDIGCGL